MPKIGTLSTQKRRVTELYSLAVDILESEENAMCWLSQPNPSLGGAIPRELCKTIKGAESAIKTLGRIEHGIFG
jgi:putative toxin-antitoxin system antitoxin component (TIGR02293 family)